VVQLEGQPEEEVTDMATETISLVPTWGAAMSIAIMCLENPNASVEGRMAAREEIMRLARAMDNIIEENRKEIDHE
jgi:hypothetical protein